MKTKKYIYSNITFFLMLMLIATTSCERELSDDVVESTFPTTAEIFTDAPVGLTDEFFISFDPVEGANPEGFGTDDNEAYIGTSSIRIDVPTPNDPDGGFIGGIFRDRGEGRDLSGYDALTLWIKGSTTATVGLLGFGTDFEANTYPVSLNDVELSTKWKKVIIPIPDASKLTQEKGMFIFSAGTSSTSGLGFTFWMDEIKFEKLGNIAHQMPKMLNGEDEIKTSFTGSKIQITGLTNTFNNASGNNISINAAGHYYKFETSNTGVATVTRSGVVSVVGEGDAKITATLAGIPVEGSLTINGEGEFPHAPIPSVAASKVVSLFSDAYTNVPVRHYNGFFAPWQTTLGGAGADSNNVDIQAPFSNGSVDNIINYTELNFVSIGAYETVSLVDASSTTHLHVDINVRESLDTSDFIKLEIESGTGSASPTSGSYTLSSTDLGNVDADGWVSIDVSLSSFGGIDTANIGQLFFVSDATVSDIWVDNVYFYKQ